MDDDQLDPNPFRTGEWLTAQYEGQQVKAQVMLASGNGRSLAIKFEAILGGFVGMMPIFQDDDGTYRDILLGKPVKLERLEKKTPLHELLARRCNYCMWQGAQAFAKQTGQELTTEETCPPGINVLIGGQKAMWLPRIPEKCFCR
jgi:hypothetical protein